MLMHHLKFVDQVRAAKGQPDVWIMVLMDGVQTHVTVSMLEFFAVNKIICGLRPPPNTSHLVQNEDLVTFWQFRNDKDSGYNKVKQAHLAKLMNLAVSRNSLDFRDAMAVIAPGWYAAFAAKHQERAWLEGGVYPFLRRPQRLVGRKEKLEAQRCSGVAPPPPPQVKKTSRRRQASRSKRI